MAYALRQGLLRRFGIPMLELELHPGWYLAR
jgi:hypothetical protein